MAKFEPKTGMQLSMRNDDGEYIPMQLIAQTVRFFAPKCMPSPESFTFKVIAPRTDGVIEFYDCDSDGFAAAGIYIAWADKEPVRMSIAGQPPAWFVIDELGLIVNTARFHSLHAKPVDAPAFAGPDLMAGE